MTAQPSARRDACQPARPALDWFCTKGNTDMWSNATKRCGAGWRRNSASSSNLRRQFSSRAVKSCIRRLCPTSALLWWTWNGDWRMDASHVAVTHKKRSKVDPCTQCRGKPLLPGPVTCPVLNHVLTLPPHDRKTSEM